MQLGNLFCKNESKQSRLWRLTHPHHFFSLKQLFKNGKMFPVQDGRIEGHLLISSCESTKISQPDVEQPPTGACWNLPKKRYPTSKNKEEDAAKWLQEHNHDKIKSHTHQVGDWKPGEQYQRSSPTVSKVLNPTSGFPAWGSDKEMVLPRESGLEGQWDLITRLPQDWGKRRLQSWRAKTKPFIHEDPEERDSDPTGDYLLVLEGLQRRRSLAEAHHRDGALAAGQQGTHWHKPSWSSPLT